MNAKTHITVGVTLGVITSSFISRNVDDITAYMCCCAIASIFPDIDHKGSTIRKYIPLFPKCKHRGITHSFIGASLFAIMAVVLFGINPITAGLIVGYISHILADIFNKGGEELLYPIQIRFKVANVITGSGGEEKFRCCILFLLIVLLL